MGEPKALLPFGNGRLLDHVAARLRPQVSTILLNANDPAITLEGVATLPDSVTGFAGPLAGIHRGLSHVRERLPPTSHVLTLPVDCPFFPEDLAGRLTASLTSADDVALASSGGQVHPVIGLWPVGLADRLAAWLADPPTLKVRAFLDREPLQVVEFAIRDSEFGTVDPFFNVNTPEDHALSLRLLGAAAS